MKGHTNKYYKQFWIQSRREQDMWYISRHKISPSFIGLEFKVSKDTLKEAKDWIDNWHEADKKIDYTIKH